VAFLAAFGRFTVSGPGGPDPGPDRQDRGPGLELTQFLLLDYPGEADFLAAALAFIEDRRRETAGPLFLTTYNGKAFDYPLLKTRCLMNGLAAPALFQADLLHPARRLWKRILPNCSQATVETVIPGPDRRGDLPGSLAPDIWFAFVRSGAAFPPDNPPGPGDYSGPAGALEGICEHNVKDIFGLASIFRAFTDIAGEPLEAVRRFRCDGENLALCWRRAALCAATAEAGGAQAGSAEAGVSAQAGGASAEAGTADMAERLLEAAAAEYPRTCLRLAFDRMRRGRHEAGRAALLRIAAAPVEAGAGRWKVPCSPALRAAALRSLAVDAERRLGLRDRALAYIEAALAAADTDGAISGGERDPGGPDTGGQDPGGLPRGLRADLEKRRERLAGAGIPPGPPFGV
jgi:hypothetical protein